MKQNQAKGWYTTMDQVKTGLILLLLLVVAVPFQISAQDEIKRYTENYPLETTQANGIRVAYKVIGQPTDTPVLLIMGLGASHRLWGDDFVKGIVDQGYRVVLFDNRDVGESQRFDAHGQPWMWWQFLRNQIGFGVDAPYSLNDMADDSVALLDALDIDDAHIVGASMGGMIAQVIAARHPTRTRSLISIMSTTGAPHLPPPSAEAGARLQDAASGEGDRNEYLRSMGLHTEAIPRQMLAIMDRGDRSEEVKTIKVPTLVLHGADDGLLPPPHGEHTASLITGSELVIFEGMGHNMPAEVMPEILKNMLEHMRGVDLVPMQEAV
jgi:pimeloyl-ACP methyl ester carboxylesterase